MINGLQCGYLRLLTVSLYVRLISDLGCKGGYQSLLPVSLYVCEADIRSGLQVGGYPRLLTVSLYGWKSASDNIITVCEADIRSGLQGWKSPIVNSITIGKHNLLTFCPFIQLSIARVGSGSGPNPGIHRSAGRNPICVVWYSM